MNKPIATAWHSAFCEHILERYRLGSLPHAVLVYGVKGIAKKQAVDAVAQSLLCQNIIDGQACGVCHACQLYITGNHPNVTRLSPEKNEEKNTQSPIKIDQIRELSNKLIMTSQYQGPNIAVINQADMMNHFAANSLLKTLEEPTANTIIFLITDKPSQLLATIRSRCQSYLLNKPSSDAALSWLKQQTKATDKEYSQALDIASGAPLVALDVLENDVIKHRLALIESLLAMLNNQCTIAQTTEQSLKLDFQQCAYFIQNFLADIIRLHHSDDKENILNLDLVKHIKQLSIKVSVKHAYLLLDDVNNMLKTYNASINVQLMLESFFASWHNMTIAGTKTV